MTPGPPGPSIPFPQAGQGENLPIIHTFEEELVTEPSGHLSVCHVYSPTSG